LLASRFKSVVSKGDQRGTNHFHTSGLFTILFGHKLRAKTKANFSEPLPVKIPLQFLKNLERYLERKWQQNKAKKVFNFNTNHDYILSKAFQRYGDIYQSKIDPKIKKPSILEGPICYLEPKWLRLSERMQNFPRNY